MVGTPLLVFFFDGAQAVEVAEEVVSRGGILPRRRRKTYEPKKTRDLVSEAVDEFLDKQEAKSRARSKPAEPVPSVEPRPGSGEATPDALTSVLPQLEIAALGLEAHVLERRIADILTARQRQEDEDMLILLMASI